MAADFLSKKFIFILLAVLAAGGFLYFFPIRFQEKRESPLAEESQMVSAWKTRNEARIANLRLLQLGLTLYRTKNNQYPLSEDPEKISRANFKNSVLYKALTADARFGINPDSFPLDPDDASYFQYQSLNNGKEYLLTGQLEGVEPNTYLISGK